MSKGRVWNKGKRNGGGGPPKSPNLSPPRDGRDGADTGLVKREAAEKSLDNTISTASLERIEQVKPANRASWVTRPARVKREKS
ncbi:MAG TPA: hypothetical protein VGE40_11675 [Bacilli bacterium]